MTIPPLSRAHKGHKAHYAIFGVRVIYVAPTNQHDGMHGMSACKSRQAGYAVLSG